MSTDGRRTIRSFDRTRTVMATMVTPASVAGLRPSTGGGMIARGAGLSYADAGMVADGTVFDMRAMHRILAFDADSGFIDVEPGVTVGALQTALTAQGRLYPVVPGYPAITVGGCIGFNVHGKGQARDGTFGDWVERMAVWHPDHGVVECSRDVRRDLFDLTIGGLGLTGVIVRATLRTRALKGDRVQQRWVYARSLREAAEVIRDEGVRVDHAYSWNDLNRRGARFGEGVVFLEDARDGDGSGLPRGYGDRLSGERRPSPLTPPDWVLRIEGLGFRLMHRYGGSGRELSLHDAMFPIVGKELYFRQFGGGGFREYQTLIPWDGWPTFVAEIESTLVRLGATASLGSLKVFRGAGHNLSFCGEGVGFTIDVPNDARSLPLFAAIDDIVLACGGVVNLSKDSRVGADVVRRAFPAYDSFRSAVHAHDPARRFASDLSHRIGL